MHNFTRLVSFDTREGFFIVLYRFKYVSFFFYAHDVIASSQQTNIGLFIGLFWHMCRSLLTRMMPITQDSLQVSFDTRHVWVSFAYI